jgi:hypothetical protein
MLLERRVLLVSQHYSVLVEVAESLRALMYPLTWCLPYVPVLPRPMSDYLECPTPYLFGIGRDWAHAELLPEAADDLVLVDLDHNHLRGNCEAPPLPELQDRELRERLRECNCDPLASVDELGAPASAAPGGARAFPDAAVRAAFHSTVLSLLVDVPRCSFRLSEAGSLKGGSAASATSAKGVQSAAIQEAVVFDEPKFLALHARRQSQRTSSGIARPDPFMEQMLRAQAFSTFVGAGGQLHKGVVEDDA